MRLRWILVRPRNPENIGAAARAMANFGFLDLVAVAPYAPTWREAVSAVGAERLLMQAKSFQTIEEAAGDCQLLLATTTGRRRSAGPLAIPAPEVGAYLSKRTPGVQNAAILFGSEKTGLPSKILDRCDAWVTIPTDPSCPSMNLAQAVAICCYEIYKYYAKAHANTPEMEKFIGFRQKVELVAQAAGMFRRVGYLNHLPAEQKSKLLWNFFNQWDIGHRQAAFLHGLIRSIEKAVPGA